MKYIPLLVLMLAALAVGHSANAQDDTVSEANQSATITTVRAAPRAMANIRIPGKILLRNKATFKGKRKIEGASSSLIIKNDKVYLLTAKHLLGEAMGISPQVPPTKLTSNLRKWTVRHNDSPDTVAKVTGIYNPNDNWDEDVILLKTNANADKAYGYSIDVAKTKPKLGDKLYVIGCPLELESCVQRAYAGTVIEFTNFEQDPDMPENLFLLDMIHAPKEITGFSGAAVLNEDMEVVAVIVGGNRTLMAAGLLPDWITH